MLSRREFLATTAGAALAAAAGSLPAAPEKKFRVWLVKPATRQEGVKELLRLAAFEAERQHVVVKPNFNSADPPPGSTHMDTLAAVLEQARRSGARALTIADRSGMGNTRQVFEKKGALDLAQATGAKAVVLDELPKSEWTHKDLPGSHWSRGVEIPNLFLAGDPIVQVCCLKTHRFGGHITLSLKNSVGMVAKYSVEDRYNYMGELHRSPDQRRMIAEINQLYRPALALMDAMEAFVSEGPDRGRRVEPGLMLASRDRVALDAVGVALLRMYGVEQPNVAQGRIFEVEQLARAAELALGARSVEEIEIVAAKGESERLAGQVRAALKA